MLQKKPCKIPKKLHELNCNARHITVANSPEREEIAKARQILAKYLQEHAHTPERHPVHLRIDLVEKQLFELSRPLRQFSLVCIDVSLKFRF